MVAVLGQDAGELPGHAGPAHGHHPADGVLGQDGHDARLDGDVDAGDAGPLQEAEEVLVVKEELADQVLGPGVHLLLQVPDVADQVGALQVPLGVAGGGHAEVPPGVDIGHQVAGVGEVGLGGDVRVHVPPEGQHVLHPVPLQLGQQVVHLRPSGGHAGQVGHGGDVVAVLDDGGDLVGGLIHLGASRPEGDADEVGADVLQAVQGGVDAVHRHVPLGGEHLAGEYRPALSEQLCQSHGKASF